MLHFLECLRNGTISGTSMSEPNLPEWEQLISAAAHLQQILPGATLVHLKRHDWNRVKEICATIAVDLFRRL